MSIQALIFERLDLAAFVGGGCSNQTSTVRIIPDLLDVLRDEENISHGYLKSAVSFSSFSDNINILAGRQAKINPCNIQRWFFWNCWFYIE